MPDRPVTSVSLLIRARSGDEAAWARIVDIYGPLVYQQCRRQGLSEADGEEVTQDVFLAVSQQLASFRRDRPGDSFLHWIRTIASRSIVNWIRKNAGKANAVGGSTANQWLEQIPEQMEAEWNPDEMKRKALRRALELMKTDFQKHTWQAFYMSFVESRATADICEELNMNPGAVRQARSKVKKRLVEELGDLLDLRS